MSDDWSYLTDDELDALVQPGEDITPMSPDLMLRIMRATDSLPDPMTCPELLASGWWAS